MLPPISRDAILSVDDLTREAVDVPEWGGSVHVRRLDVGGLFRVLDSAGKPEFNARLAIAAVCQEDGSPVFTDADLPALQARSGAALLRIARVAQRLNGLTVEAQERAGNA